jgi:hypothetical protein
MEEIENGFFSIGPPEKSTHAKPENVGLSLTGRYRSAWSIEIGLYVCHLGFEFWNRSRQVSRLFDFGTRMIAELLES